MKTAPVLDFDATGSESNADANCNQDTGRTFTLGIDFVDRRITCIRIKIVVFSRIPNWIPREPSAEVAGVVAVAVELQAGLRVPLSSSVEVRVADVACAVGVVGKIGI